METLLGQDLPQQLQAFIEGKTYKLVNDYSQQTLRLSSLSARSVERFCADHGIMKRKGSDLDKIMAHRSVAA